MADTVQFDLVSPERRLTSGPVSQVLIPGAEGDMVAMPDHAPVITNLRPGILRIEGPDGEDEYVVTGGFAEISANGISVLAEWSLHRGDVTQEHYDKMLQDARDAFEKAQTVFKNEPGPVDDAAKVLADMVAMGDHINLDPAVGRG